MTFSRRLQASALTALFVALLGSGGLLAQQPTVTLVGVPHPLTLTREDLAMLPRTSLKASSHGDTATYEGVAVRELLTRAGVATGDGLRGPELTKVVVVTGSDGYQAAFSVAEFDPGFTDRVSLLADTKDGQPLAGTAGPFQLILEGEKRPARWVRMVVSITVAAAGSVK